MFVRRYLIYLHNIYSLTIGEVFGVWIVADVFVVGVAVVVEETVI